MSHEDYKEMLAEHALGALDAADARSLEAHLATCADCSAELARWLDTTATLAYAAPRVEPPLQLRSRLLENIRAEKQDAPRPATKEREDSSIDVRSEAKQAPDKSNLIQMPEKSRTRWNTMQRFGALAASLAFAAFIITLVVLWNRNRSMQAELAKLSKDLQTTQQQLKREREISEMFSAPDTRVATLTGTEMAPRAQARLAYNKSGNAMMIVDGLPPAPAGKDYQIWFIADGKPLPGGVFKPDNAGHVEMHDQVPLQARSAAAFAITLEPQGGTPAPTGQKYLLGTATS
jgi:anti-sigma-K factor RskA